MSESRNYTRTRTKSSRLREIEDDEISSDASSIRKVETDETTAMGEDSNEGTELESDEESSDEDNEDEGDVDYIDSADSKKRKSKMKEPKKPRSLKKLKISTYGPSTTAAVIIELRKNQELYLESVKEFEPTKLFSILATEDDISIDELVREFLEGYSENRDTFIQKFINLLLDCCGVMTHVEEHDVHSNESANDTVSEVQLSFQKQKLHEFYLLVSKNNKKRSQYKPLYQNFIEFMSKLLEVANDLQLLYDESGGDDSMDDDDDENENTSIKMGPLVLDLLTWLSSFSVCKIRSFRYISTLTFYLFQDFISEHAVDLEKNYLAKYTKQLSMENKKKRPNQKTIEKLEINISEIQNNKIIIDNIIDNIVKLCFVHRFKDVDELIRSESILHLSIWISNDPEYFMKVTFLKYFGWLLSDSSSIVRLQVLKSLPNIIKSSHYSSMVDNSAIRQFFERFKERVLDIAIHDSDQEVRIHAIHVLIEASALDYLEDSEILSISSLIFDNNEVNVASFGKTSRFLSSVAKFLARVATEKYEEFSKNNKLDEHMSKVETSSIIKIGIIIRLLSSSLLYYIENNKNDANSKLSKSQILLQAAEFLYPYFGPQIENICKLLTDDNGFQSVYNAITEASKELAHNEQSTDYDGDDSGQLVRIDISPLLPRENNEVILYVTTLSGLCNGGKNIKNQSKYGIAESVLPHLEGLFKNLSSDVPEIFTQILNIFNLFEFDEWIQTGSEKNIEKINSMILKGFNTVNLLSSDPNDIVYKTFSQTLKHIREFKLNEIDELWINQVSLLKLQLAKYLNKKEHNKTSDVDFMEFSNSLYSHYINRLLLLGKEYSVEFDQELVDSYFKEFVSKLALEIELSEFDDIEQVNFKLPVLLITWQLQKWVDILKQTVKISGTGKNVDTSNDGASITSSDSVTQSFDYISNIIKHLNVTLLQLNNASEVSVRSNVYVLKWNLSNAIIDALVSLRCFELQLPAYDVYWRNTLKNAVPTYLNDATTSILLDVFLFLESLAAEDQNIQLDRLHNEDIYFNDLSSMTDKIGNSERNLLIYTIKLKGLMKLELLPNNVVNRVALNKDKLGSMFENIIDEAIFEEEASKTQMNRSHKVAKLPLQQSPEPIQINEHSSIAHGTQEILEPIDETSQSSVAQGSDNDLHSIQEKSNGLSKDPIESTRDPTQSSNRNSTQQSTQTDHNISSEI